jgi:beta-carotene hydroxylase
MLRHRPDWRTLLWAYVLFPAVGLAYYVEPRLVPWMLPVSLYFGFCAGVFSHNHNHCPTFKSRRLNAVHSSWISIFYGYPTFGWIPSHNLNHHKFVNKAGDASITWRYTNKNTWLVASTYYFVSAYFQGGTLKEYTAKAKTQNPTLYRQILAQRATVIGGHAAFLALGIAAAVLWHHMAWWHGVVLWLFGFGIPAAFSNWSMFFINYIQHVHTDPWSEHDHSRNFVSKFGNFMVFNNGFHTAHHESAGLHWSKLAAAHAKIAHRIHPELNQQSIFGFCIKAYLFGIFSRRFRTQQIGRAPFDPPTGEALKLETASVAAVEAGVNASMA